ncbi:MAG TPA: 16S rRNA (guanine(527)-N(7))-methyltransferase RsmG [Holosporales bacterium]|nr:16S rRNA (guanine(527)-N(7))-methyltransferase RsmG [Holosporales bacterium]
MLSPLNVSRETIDKLKIYEALLLKWQPHLNLVSKTTLKDIWERHFLDSAQLFDETSNKNLFVCDLGSGAGFPGAVLAIMGCKNVTLIERDRKKCSFLRSVSRETKVTFSVFEGDVKDFLHKADIITSRALAPLKDLLLLAEPLVKPTTICLFLKGNSIDTELKEVPFDIKMNVSKKQSITSSEGALLTLKNIVFPAR